MKLWDSGYNFKVEPTGTAEALDLVLKKTVSQEDHKGLSLDTCGRLPFFFFNLRDTEEGAYFRVGGGDDSVQVWSLH